MTRGLLLAILLLVAGCASTGEGDPRDPFEGFNRGIYKFNETVDEAIAKPVATAYRDVVHEEIRNRVRNFFSNIGDVFIGVNNVLQGKFFEGFEDFMRVTFNTTLGLLGIHDVASDMGIEKHNEDFGQTFGRWGAGPGPYLVLPILGSSTVRDGAGTAIDIYADPLGEARPIRLRNSLVVLRLTGARADLLEASRILEQAALDKYVFQRDAYLQRRRNLVYDGRPPREPREPEEEQKPEKPQTPGKPEK
ncbi:MAG TPA: VacJ family lipoprotein [Burkholderiales bacterium]|nr:VacJ family lipoprotein [Burkholderiales bacterium]